MSDTTATLRRKIDGAAELRSVVRTMKALAASSIVQYERSVTALADYDRVVQLGLGASFRQLGTLEPAIEHQAAPQSARDTLTAVVFGSDQGLVGQFNDTIADHAAEMLLSTPATIRIWAVGDRVQTRLVSVGLAVQGVFSVPSSVRMISSLVGRILLQTEALRLQDRVGALYLFYNRTTTGASYIPYHQRLLPLDAAWRRQRMMLSWPARTLPQVLGAGTTTLAALIGEYLFVSLFRACAESLASENSSRLAAMQRAEKSIDELLDGLNASFHRLRQSSIDEELFDVISAFVALS